MATAADTGLRDAQVCIPGGTFWMGDFRRQGSGGQFDAVPEHVVTVSPFFLDEHEYTVGRYRAALAAGFAPSSPPDENGSCPLGAPAGSNGDIPLACIDAFGAIETVRGKGDGWPPRPTPSAIHHPRTRCWAGP